MSTYVLSKALDFNFKDLSMRVSPDDPLFSRYS